LSAWNPRKLNGSNISIFNVDLNNTFFKKVKKVLIANIFRGFKALKQTVKLYYRLGRYSEMMDAYREMLTYIKSAVTRNYSEKCINNIMDFVSGSASHNFSLLQEFYQTTLRALEESKNEVSFLHFRIQNISVITFYPSLYATSSDVILNAGRERPR
jgi:hypothetical protein